MLKKWGMKNMNTKKLLHISQNEHTQKILSWINTDMKQKKNN